MQSEIPSASEDWSMAFATEGSHLAPSFTFKRGIRDYPHRAIKPSKSQTRLE